MTNPNSVPESASDDNVAEDNKPQPVVADTATKDVEQTSSHPAAEVLPTPAAPKLSASYDPESIVNFDYLEEEGQADELSYDEMLSLINQYEETLTDIQEGQILKGTVIEVRENEVLLNIGFKSEGVINLDEFGATEVNVDDTFDVFLEKLENLDGLVVLSKERADFLKVWDKIKLAHEAGDIVTGAVDRRIKGGLVVKLWASIRSCPAARLPYARCLTWKI